MEHSRVQAEPHDAARWRNACGRIKSEVGYYDGQARLCFFRVSLPFTRLRWYRAHSTNARTSSCTRGTNRFQILDEVGVHHPRRVGNLDPIADDDDGTSRTRFKNGQKRIPGYEATLPANVQPKL